LVLDTNIRQLPVWITNYTGFWKVYNKECGCAVIIPQVFTYLYPEHN
jgi:hypothetical protein